MTTRCKIFLFRFDLMRMMKNQLGIKVKGILIKRNIIRMIAIVLLLISEKPSTLTIQSPKNIKKHLNSSRFQHLDKIMNLKSLIILIGMMILQAINPQAKEVVCGMTVLNFICKLIFQRSNKANSQSKKKTNRKKK